MKIVMYLLAALSCLPLFSQNRISSNISNYVGIQITSERPMMFELTWFCKKSRFFNLKTKFSTGNYNSLVLKSFDSYYKNGYIYSGGNAYYNFSGTHYSGSLGYFMNLSENATGAWFLGINFPFGITQDHLNLTLFSDPVFGNRPWKFEESGFALSSELELLRTLRLGRFIYHYGVSFATPLYYKNPFEDELPKYINPNRFIAGVGYSPLFKIQLGVQYLLKKK